MKTNWGNCFSMRGWMAFSLALFTFTSLSRADTTMVDNLSAIGNLTVKYTAPLGNTYESQIFTTGDDGGDIGAIALNLSVSGTSSGILDVYLISSLVDNGSTDFGTSIGTISISGASSGGTFDVDDIAATALTADTTYAIAINTAELSGVGDAISWGYISPTDAGTYFQGEVGASFGGAFNGNGTDWNNDKSSSQQRLMDLEVVPEPTTAMLMGICAMGIAVAHALRRKIGGVS